MSFQKYHRLWLLISLLTILSIIAIFSNLNFANSSIITQTTARNNIITYSYPCNISIIECIDNIHYHNHQYTQPKKDFDKLQIDQILEKVNSTKLKQYIDLLSSF